MVEDSHPIPEALTPQPIVTEVNGSIAVVRFNRPAQRNPLSSVEAFKFGLISDVADPVLDPALELAGRKKKVAEDPPPSSTGD